VLIRLPGCATCSVAKPCFDKSQTGSRLRRTVRERAVQVTSVIYEMDRPNLDGLRPASRFSDRHYAVRQDLYPVGSKFGRFPPDATETEAKQSAGLSGKIFIWPILYSAGAPAFHGLAMDVGPSTDVRASAGDRTKRNTSTGKAGQRTREGWKVDRCGFSLEAPGRALSTYDACSGHDDFGDGRLKHAVRIRRGQTCRSLRSKP
jgi:hypothetical protein